MSVRIERARESSSRVDERRVFFLWGERHATSERRTRLEERMCQEHLPGAVGNDALGCLLLGLRATH